MLRTSGAQNVVKKRYMKYTFFLGLHGVLYPLELLTTDTYYDSLRNCIVLLSTIYPVKKKKWYRFRAKHEH